DGADRPLHHRAGGQLWLLPPDRLLVRDLAAVEHPRAHGPAVRPGPRVRDLAVYLQSHPALPLAADHGGAEPAKPALGAALRGRLPDQPEGGAGSAGDPAPPGAPDGADRAPGRGDPRDPP